MEEGSEYTETEGLYLELVKHLTEKVNTAYAAMNVYGTHSEQEEVQVPVESEEITVKVSAKNPPASVQHQFETAKQLRLIFRTLVVPPLQIQAIDQAFAELEGAINSRSSKERRLETLNRVRAVINSESKKRLVGFEQAKALVQTLPTTPGLPVTNSDNIVRAIVAILRSNGAIT